MQTSARSEVGSPAFTLIELLTTVAIIGVLAALLYPVGRTAITHTQSAQCMSRLRQIHLASEAYSQDNDGRLVPGSALGTSPFWLYTLRPYLGGRDIWDTSVDDRFRCPSLKPGRPNYWAWGYGMNARPGYEGTDSTAYDKLANWGPASSGWTRPFQSVAITHKSRRLFVCDGVEWQVAPAASAGATAPFPDYQRHGKNTCNALFFDGHVEALNPDRINQALFDPGKP